MHGRGVIITDNLEEDLSRFLRATDYDRLFILTDTNTREKCYPLLQNNPLVQSGRLITIQPGDGNKTPEQLSTIWQALSSEGASRSSLLINLGGGMITDIGGFAGATFKRGLRTLNIPTTLMASVDAAVGGKTGVNFNGLKNEIGSFHTPVCVLIDCRFLRTLDRDNILSGYAEMIKHALISSEEACAQVFAFDPDKPDDSLLNQMVAQSVAIKERIVEEDPHEKGIRKALNLGHTVGHAIESLSFEGDAPLLHGHAVAAGLVCELYLSYKQCGFPSSKLSQVVHYIREYYPPFFFHCKAYDYLYERMTHDKKNENGVISFTLLSDTGGKIHINQSVSKERIFESLDFYRESFGL
ncbi:MAG: 3-dehydroquinate synthase [Tannerellaceae bacterium]|jgi:3-dehydroquinate synthase|nr:3-dehydroquinate synthase [Tannerellaceae bacterium]